LSVDQTFKFNDYCSLASTNSVVLCACQEGYDNRIIVLLNRELCVIEAETTSGDESDGLYTFTTKSSQDFSNCTLIDDEYLYAI
jgi:hypothetical protein